MIFDTIRYGTFTADDFINAYNNNDFNKFTSLPIDIRKQFIGDVIDIADKEHPNKEHPNKESNNFKQAAFDFIDGKITEDQFREAYWKYRVAAVATAVVQAAAPAVAVATAAVAVVGVAAVVQYYRPYLEQYAKHLNKVIQEYERS
jgi:hypothetical protein